MKHFQVPFNIDLATRLFRILFKTSVSKEKGYLRVKGIRKFSSFLIKDKNYSPVPNNSPLPADCLDFLSDPDLEN